MIVRRLSKGWDAVRRVIASCRRNRGAILMYHSVSTRDDYFWSVDPEMFKAQMEYLAKTYKVISLAELVRRLRHRESIRGTVVLTFDDGYADFFTNAFPVLEARNLPATVFVTTGRIGGKDERGLSYLSQEDISILARSPRITFGPHTVSHARLTTLSEDMLKAEITDSAARIESSVGTRAQYFAYPYGGYDRTVRAAVAAHGFDAAVTTKTRSVTTGDDLLLLPRIQVDRSVTERSFPDLLRSYVPAYA